MPQDTLFKKFAIFADAPNAVAKMRELVLHLAVTGYLVATAHDWQTKPLKSLATKIGSGATPAGGRESYFSEGIPLIRSMNVHFRGFEPTGLVYLSDEQAEQLSNVTVQTDDVLLNITGASIGRVTTAPSEMAGARVNQHVTIIRPTSELVPTFLSMFLASPSVQRMINDIQVGATRQALTKGMIERFEIPVPPLAEQKRIVAKVDELMALCDRLEAQQQERITRHAALSRASLSRFADAPTPANLNILFHPSYTIPPADLRKSILTLAVQGKLVPQDPCDEPAEAVVQRVQKPTKPVRFNKRSTARIQGIAALSVGPTEREIPENWTCIPLIQIARLESGHTPSRTRPDWWGGDVSWVGVVDARLHDGGTIIETRQHTNEEGLANSAARMLPTGTVCVSRTASVGYVIILGKPMATSQDFVNWVPSEAVTSDWLRLVFTSEKDAFNRFSKGAVHQTIYYPEWLSMHTLLPPLAEQCRIVAKVDQLMFLVDQLEAQLATSSATATELMEAVVHDLLTAPREETAQKKVSAASPAHAKPAKRPNQHFARAVLSAEIVDFLHDEPTFGRVKHQKIFHLCEHIAQITDIDGCYHREAAGPLDNRLIYANEAELKKQQWYAEARRESYGHSYVPLAKAGSHRRYSEQFWPDKIETIRTLILLMRDWSTDRCEIFSTAYAAWNDLLIWGREATEEAILHEILDRWNPTKKRFNPERWLAAIQWMKKQGFTPTGFGRPTATAE